MRSAIRRLPGDADAAGMEPTTQMPVDRGPRRRRHAADLSAGCAGRSRRGSGGAASRGTRSPARSSASIVAVAGDRRSHRLARSSAATTTTTARRPTSTFLVFETTDETGADIDVGFIVDRRRARPTLRSRSSGSSPTACRPARPQATRTGSDGRVAFEWEPDDTVADPAAWAVDGHRLAQQVPAGWTPPGPIVDCVLDRSTAR